MVHVWVCDAGIGDQVGDCVAGYSEGEGDRVKYEFKRQRPLNEALQLLHEGLDFC